MKKANYLLLLILPLVLVVTSVFLNRARGPYWLGGNLDPEYVYLLNAANLAGLKGVGHIDHPGTPVQVLGAVTIRVLYFFNFSATVDMQTDVMQRPEYYLNAINRVLIALEAIMLFLLGLATFRFSGSLWPALWLQSAPFFSITVLQFGLTRVTPEPFLFFSSLAMVTLLIVFLHKSNETEKLTRPNTPSGGSVENPPPRTRLLNFLSTQPLIFFLFALVTGFGIANKITFLPTAIIPLVIIPKIKNKIYYLVGVGIGFVVFTLPIIRMYPRFFGWIVDLLTHSGRYGSGPSQLLSTESYLQNLKTLLSGNLLFSASLILAFVAIAFSVFIPKWRRTAGSTFYFKLLVAIAAAQLFGLLMVSKHSSHHYLMPVLNLAGLALLLVFLLLKHILEPGKKGRKILIIAAPVLFILAFVLVNPINRFNKTISQLTSLKEKSLALYAEVETGYADYAKVYYYRSSSPAYALKFGNDLSRSYHSQTLQKIYKDTWFYDIWTRRYTTFDYNETVPFETLRARYNDKILFQGSRGLKIPGLQLKDVAKIRFYEGIFVIE